MLIQEDQFHKLKLSIRTGGDGNIPCLCDDPKKKLTSFVRAKVMTIATC